MDHISDDFSQTGNEKIRLNTESRVLLDCVNCSGNVACPSFDVFILGYIAASIRRHSTFKLLIYQALLCAKYCEVDGAMKCYVVSGCVHR